MDVDPSFSDRKVWLVVAYVMAGLTAILIILTLVMIRRIKVGQHNVQWSHAHHCPTSPTKVHDVTGFKVVGCPRRIVPYHLQQCVRPDKLVCP